MLTNIAILNEWSWIVFPFMSTYVPVFTIRRQNRGICREVYEKIECRTSKYRKLEVGYYGAIK